MNYIYSTWLNTWNLIPHYLVFKKIQGLTYRMANLGIYDNMRNYENASGGVVALACKMVGGGSDGSLDLCARVCLIDEYENIIFHTYVNPQLPVTNFRYLTIKYNLLYPSINPGKINYICNYM